jgi:hypothetical protein
MIRTTILPHEALSMPVPTEILNEDIKELKAEVRDIRGDLDVLKADIHRMDVSLAELRSDVRSAISLGKWAGTVLVGLMLTGGVSAVWWASRVDADVRNLAVRYDERFKAVDARFDKLEARIDARLDKLEATIVKALDHAKAQPVSSPAVNRSSVPTETQPGTEGGD